jgi:hypothetical protein
MAQNEKIKRYLVLGLAVAALVVAYFQFFKPKDDTRMVISEPVGVINQPVVKSVTHKIVPPQKIRPQISSPPKETQRLFLITDMRDIFEPPPIPPELKKKTMTGERDKKVSNIVVPDDIPLTLSGTIVGGSKPMAIINEKFVKLGEKIDRFKVVRIEANKVVLRAGTHERILTVLKPDELLK